MPKLIYTMSVSLDGFIAGPGGEIDWSAPDQELHRFHNQQTRELGAHLLGRRLYEEMLYWETADQNPSARDYELEFARIWKDLPKIVFSSTLEKVEGNARLAKDGVAEEVATLKDQPGKDLEVGGAGPSLRLHQAGPRRRVPALRQSGRTGRGHALLPGPGREGQPGAGRDTDVWLSRRLCSLPACVRRPAGLIVACAPDRIGHPPARCGVRRRWPWLSGCG